MVAGGRSGVEPDRPPFRRWRVMGVFRGLLFALPIALALWAVIFWAIGWLP